VGEVGDEPVDVTLGGPDERGERISIASARGDRRRGDVGVVRAFDHVGMLTGISGSPGTITERPATIGP
jgi:hypothetical protein